MQESVLAPSSTAIEDMSVPPVDSLVICQEIENAKEQKRIEEAIWRAEQPSFARNLLWEDGEHKYVSSTLVSETTESLPDAPPINCLHKALVDMVNEHPDLFWIVTPIDPDAFCEKLQKHPNCTFIALVLHGLIHGFWPFTEIPGDYPTSEDLHHDNPSDDEKLEFYIAQCEKEFKLGHFSKPFGKHLLPGMACMLVFITQQNGKFRMITDHSYGWFPWTEHAF